MRIHLGANYEGYRTARALSRSLSAAGHEVIWHAAPAYDEGDDYPAISIRTIQAVVADEDAGVDALAVIVSGNGGGEAIAANKVNGARVVAATDAGYAASARRHSDANGIVLPVVHLDDERISEVVTAFLTTEFARGFDDARRLVNIAEFETAGTIEGWMLQE